MQALLVPTSGAQNSPPLHLLANVPNVKSLQPARSHAPGKQPQKLWESIVDKLPQRDAETEWFTLSDIAPLVGLTPNSLSKHARDLWPRHSGHWRLDHAEAVRLIRRVCVAGKKVKL